ncbi:hypothetical protein KJ068_29240 [bacterium]|nr:hypothetical protein [bacterium]
MAKAPYKLPNVFVGCPYGGKFKFANFKSTLEKIPFKFFYADTRLSSKHLLEILRKYISTADFCIFDISTWNPNVALEIGLAEGLGVEYYILLHRKLSKGVPSDIQGIQRIEYSTYDDFDERNGLLPQFIKYLVMDHTHPRNIWEALEADPSRERKYYLALRFLAHFRDRKRLTSEDVQRLSRGSYLRKADQEQVLETLSDLGLVSTTKSRLGSSLKKRLYHDDIA